MNLDVVLPFHRADRYFESSILSLAQTKNVSFRTILIDDRIDKSEDLSSLFNNLKLFSVVETPGGIGYGKSLGYGSKLVESDAIALFNSDDLISPDRLSRQYDQLNNHEISVTNMARINAQGKRNKSILGEISSRAYDPIYLALGSYGANATWCVRKTWWDKFVYFDSDECLDWRIALTSFCSSNIGFISEPLYFYRKHSDQVTNNYNPSKTKMEVIYKAWSTFIASIGIEAAEYSTFSVLATPWDSNAYKINIKELVKTIGQIYNFANQLDPTVSINVKKLVQRRCIFAIRKSKSVSDLIHLFRMGMPQTTGITNDLLNNLITNRYSLGK
jgi:glycosyltransferase involved in cell wall biosynthesis